MSDFSDPPPLTEDAGKAWVLVGCKKGKYDKGEGRCMVGLRAHVVRVPDRE